MIDCASNAGLIAITEVGRKDPGRQPSAEELGGAGLAGLGLGRFLGDRRRQRVRTRASAFSTKAAIFAPVYLDEITRLVGDAAPRLIWEAPLRAQQAYLVCRFGANVSLGNIVPQECLALEALRCGLRFETFAAVARQSLDDGRWDPTHVETEPRLEIGELKK